MLAEAVTLGVILCHKTVKGNSQHEIGISKGREGSWSPPLLSPHLMDGGTEAQRVGVNFSAAGQEEESTRWGKRLVRPSLPVIISLPVPPLLLPYRYKAGS